MKNQAVEAKNVEKRFFFDFTYILVLLTTCETQ